MRTCAIASLLTVALAMPALAATVKYYVVVDPVGNCSVVNSKPSATTGLAIVGDKGGYDSVDAANKVLKTNPKSKCTEPMADLFLVSYSSSGDNSALAGGNWIKIGEFTEARCNKVADNLNPIARRASTAKSETGALSVNSNVIVVGVCVPTK